LKFLLKHLVILLNSIFINKFEKDFINLNSSNKFFQENNFKNKKTIIIQVVTDYYYLAYYKTLILDKKFLNYNFIGLWPYFQQTVRKRNLVIELLNEIYNKFLFIFIYRKWSKLYASIGIKKIEKIYTNKIFINKNFFNFFIKNKKALLSLKINKIYLGDIIYDTYLRFRAKPTVFVKDYFLFNLIEKSAIIISNLKKIYKKYKPIYFFTSYSSYIHHGLPVRFFLKNNVIVFSGKNNSQYNKKLSITNFSHAEDYKKYKLYYHIIKKNKNFINFSKKDLLQRFSKNKKSVNNSSYLLVDTYYPKIKSFKELDKLKNIEGVLFLQDFYDSPHDWGNLAFNDFYIWTIFTLNIIRKYKLKIAIKPHPNSWHNSMDSVLIYKRLRNRYKDLIWLDSNFSNYLIFKKIKFVISATGTVLFEMAYHDIKAISCGDHPGKDFNFTIHAKNKNDYKKILLNIDKIKKPNYSKEDLLIYNFLYYHYNFDAFDNISRKINLKKIDFSSSKGLAEFNNKYNSYVSKENI
jgi:hypothetical protein